MSQSAKLRSEGEKIAAPLPPLLAEAHRLATAFSYGSHGRKRAGRGDEFWQYRNAMPGDAAREIDWRRSARSDGHFVRQKEWQAAQTVWIWPDCGQSMQFSSDKHHVEKCTRARVLAMALAILLIRGGERVGLLATRPLRPGSGEAQLSRIAMRISQIEGDDDFSTPDLSAVGKDARVVLISDFLGDPDKLQAQVTEVAGRGVLGVMLQILDPQEEVYPFIGRTIFQSIGGTIEHETLKARDLKDAYIQKLQQRRAVLADMSRANGWRFEAQNTGDPALGSLMWIYRALERSA